MESFFTWLSGHGKALTGTALGCVIVGMFWLNYKQANDADARFNAILKLFTEHQKEMQKDLKETARTQWQNQSKIADGLNALALVIASSLSRIEAILHIPPDQRGPMPAKPTTAAPKVAELKPPTP